MKTSPLPPKASPLSPYRLHYRSSNFLMRIYTATVLAAGMLSALPAFAVATQPFSSLTAAAADQEITLRGRISTKLPATSDTAPERWYVTDGQGAILVTLDPELLAKLPGAATNFPVGAEVRITGKVSLYRGALQVLPLSAEAIQIAPAGEPLGLETAAAQTTAAPPPALPPGALLPAAVTAAQVGQTLTVGAPVDEYRAKWKETAPTIFYLKGGEKRLEVVFWDDVLAALGERLAPMTQPGAWILVKGELGEFNGRLQLKVARAEDLALLTGATPPAQPGPASPAQAPAAAAAGPAPVVDTITRDLLGCTVTVEGETLDTHLSTGENIPTALNLQLRGGRARVVFWPEISQALGPRQAELLAPGGRIRATGEVTEFRNELQIKVRRAEDIQRAGAGPGASAAPGAPAAPGMAPAAAPSAPPAAGIEVLAPSAITRLKLGKAVRTHGKVQKFTPSRAPNVPNRVILSDGSGSIQVVYWPDAAAVFSGANAPAEGAMWGAEGEVSEYRNELQLRATAPYTP